MIYHTLPDAVSELTRRTGKIWTIADLLEFSSQTRRVLLRAKVQVDESDVRTLGRERPDVWQNDGRFMTYADVPPMEVNILQRDGVANIRHPFDGPRSWPVRKLRITLVDLVVSSSSLTKIADSQPVSVPKELAVGLTATVGRSPVGQAPAQWSLSKPKHFQGYAEPLFDHLRLAHGQGRPIPTALDVLDAWAKEKPPEVLRVTKKELAYKNRKGETKTADLEALNKTIGRYAQPK